MEFAALLVALVAVVFSVIALRRTARRPAAAPPAVPPAAAPPAAVPPAASPAAALPDQSALLAAAPTDIHQQQINDLARALSSALRHLAVVRYDAFNDVSGRLSYTAAILDDNGDGIVITSLHSRAESRTFLKGITAGTAEGLSPEEQEAVDHAMGAA